MAQKLKTASQMERHFRGMGNHYRIELLLLIDNDEGITVHAAAKRLRANFKTISQHTRYLVHAGLIQKRYKGRMVEHALSPYGKMFVGFIKEFQRIGTHTPSK